MPELAINGGPKTRREEFFAWPSFDEREIEYATSTIRSRKWFAGMRGADPGSRTREFEEKFAGYHDAAHGVACANGSVALEIALRAAGVGPGDEVIVPALTFIATLSAVLQVGAIPVMVDTVFETQCIDPAGIEKALNDSTRAVIPVHFGGFACDMEGIMELARANGLTVIEDSAHAVGTVSRGRKVGAIGAMGTFSFQESKSMTAGEGGIIVTDSPELAEQCIRYRSCGRREGESWYIHHELALNYRLAEVLSAMLLAQLEKIEEWTARKNSNARRLADGLKRSACLEPYPGDENTDVNGLYLCLLHYDSEGCGGVSRDRFVETLNAEGVPCHIGYPWPLNKNPMFDNIPEGPEGCSWSCQWNRRDPAGISEMSFPVTEKICAETVVIPHQVLLAEERDIEDIVEAVLKIERNAAELMQD